MPENEYVVATSIRNGGLRKTAKSMRLSTVVVEKETFQSFTRKLWALLVLQYTAILVLSSPFALLESFAVQVEPYHFVLECIAFGGIGVSFAIALTKGPMWPFAHIALVGLTLFVSLEMGLTFAEASWGRYGLIAIGQATTNFAIILALITMETQWLSYTTGTAICLICAGIWMLVLTMTGLSVTYACYVALGGWGYTLMVIFCSAQVAHHVSTDEYILAVLFILFPEALLCLGGKERTPEHHPDEAVSIV
mmetsp:Transcript_33880/g.41547  ORF Transcript_33880/g.41547 Transcript_33880/m.41547 type:complete len:251 (-) Transcript_33880:280-1032(-)